MQAATDEQVFDLAAKEGRIIVYADTDFGTILALRRTAEPPSSSSGALQAAVLSSRRSFSWGNFRGWRTRSNGEASW